MYSKLYRSLTCKDACKIFLKSSIDGYFVEVIRNGCHVRDTIH